MGSCPSTKRKNIHPPKHKPQSELDLWKFILAVTFQDAVYPLWMNSYTLTSKMTRFNSNLSMRTNWKLKILISTYTMCIVGKYSSGNKLILIRWKKKISVCLQVGRLEKFKRKSTDWSKLEKTLFSLSSTVKYYQYVDKKVLDDPERYSIEKFEISDYNRKCLVGKIKINPKYGE